MNQSKLFVFALVASTACSLAPLTAAEKTLPTSGPFQTIDAQALDKQTSSQWVSGQESPLAIEGGQLDPATIVWTKTTQPRLPGVRFGEGKDGGRRHLRIGLTEALTIGSVLVRGGGTLSALKP